MTVGDSNASPSAQPLWSRGILGPSELEALAAQIRPSWEVGLDADDAAVDTFVPTAGTFSANANNNGITASILFGASDLMALAGGPTTPLTPNPAAMMPASAAELPVSPHATVVDRPLPRPAPPQGTAPLTPQRAAPPPRPAPTPRAHVEVTPLEPADLPARRSSRGVIAGVIAAVAAVAIGGIVALSGSSESAPPAPPAPPVASTSPASTSPIAAVDPAPAPAVAPQLAVAPPAIPPQPVVPTPPEVAPVAQPVAADPPQPVAPPPSPRVAARSAVAPRPAPVAPLRVPPSAVVRPPPAVAARARPTTPTPTRATSAARPAGRRGAGFVADSPY